MAASFLPTSFFNSKRKVLKVVVCGHPSQEIRFSDRDPIDKVIDKVKTKFELTDEECEGFNIKVSLRGVWASPGQTIGDLLLRNNDQISFQRQPPSQHQPQLQNNQGAQTVPRKLYPGEDWVIVNEGNNAGGLRHSFSDGQLHQNLIQPLDPRVEFLSKKTYVATGKATFKFPSSINPSVLQIPPELSDIVEKPTSKPNLCNLEHEVLGKGYKESSDFEKEEMECTRYLALKRKIRRDLLDETERARQEAEQQKKEREEQEKRKKREIEDRAIASAPNRERDQIMSDPHLKQCYLNLHLERQLSAEVAARAACKFALKEANRTVFLHLVTMQIPTNVSEAVAEQKTNLEEALNVAFSLCPLVEQYPDLSVLEIQKIHNAHSTVPAMEFHTFVGNYKQMKGMGFTCDRVLAAIVQHPQDTSAALELLLSSQ